MRRATSPGAMNARLDPTTSDTLQAHTAQRVLNNLTNTLPLTKACRQ